MSSETAMQVSCLMIPLEKYSLLVPASTTVEIYRVAISVKWCQVSAGYLSEIQWRGQWIPLLALENAGLAQARSTNLPMRVVVMRSVLSKTEPRIYAILSNDMPKLIAVDAHNAAPVNGPQDAHAFASSFVSIDGELAWVPNLEKIETALTQALRQQRAQRETESLVDV
ncbi:MAG: chemotaxis protein CheW [Gammaproteobacteria bacterium]|nr:chemotaxis protein CheW [Gammaproteobacteria bacterium]